MDVESKLSSDMFDVHAYIRDVSKAMDSSTEVKRHKRSIQEIAEQTAQKLKQNVYQNYSLFINTSKEISSLEAEMYQLSHMLNEHESLTRDLSNMAIAAAQALPGEGGAEPEKHSIASLLETVEGCSSVTEVPGRFLVYSSHLTELHQVYVAFMHIHVHVQVYMYIYMYTVYLPQILYIIIHDIVCHKIMELPIPLL